MVCQYEKEYIALLYQIVEKIIATHRGSRFIKVDLHVHTPASMDWNEKNDASHQADMIEPKQIVDAALDKGVKLIAITDHNSVEWCARVIEAAKGSDLIVLPGFELTANPGVHILAIFEQDNKIVALQDLLVKLGISRERFGYADESTNAAITDHQNGQYPIIKLIQDAGGLAIPAHIELDSGLIGRIKGGLNATDFLQDSGCRILELKDRKVVPETVKKLLKDDPRRFALISNSDAHRIDKIGSENLWIKIDPAFDSKGKPKFLECLKHMGFEASTRTQFSEKTPRKKSRIVGVYSNGGILKDLAIGFSDELNCIIGGRGAGKSALLDYLRFAIGDEPESIELQQKLRKRYVDLIQVSTTVYVLVEDSKGELWLYERTLENYKTKKKEGRQIIEIQASDCIKYQVFTKTMEIKKFPTDQGEFAVDFYSQGEVQSITNQAETNRQLKLVDNFVSANILPREKKILLIETELVSIEEELNSSLTEEKEIKTRIEQLTNLNERIKEIEDDLNDETFKSFQVWEDAAQWLNELLVHLDTQLEKFKAVSISKKEPKEFVIPEPESSQIFREIQEEVIQAQKHLIEGKESIEKEAYDSKTKIAKLKKNWDSSFEQKKSDFAAKLRERGHQNLLVLTQELSEKRALVEQITQKDVPRLEEIAKSTLKIRNQRDKKLQELYQERKAIRDCRIEASSLMTKHLNDNIRVKVTKDVSKVEFFDILSDVVPDGINKPTLDRIVDYYLPTKLVSEIRLGQLEKLVACGITELTAKKLMNMPEKSLMLIERTYCSDILQIQLKIDNKHKDLGSLSEGEKCTAILSLILLDEKRPLIIDQPEDELDHDFIMSNVVDTLCNVKQRSDPVKFEHEPKAGRQFIIATHNQNIPVLGSAELVVRMQKVQDSSQCKVSTAYGLDHPETITQVLSLEGGKDAFERRRQKYFTT